MPTTEAKHKPYEAFRSTFLQRRELKALLGPRLLVQKAEDPSQVGSILIPETAQERKTCSLAEVVQVGKGWPAGEPVEVGWHVMLSPWAGQTNGSFEFDDRFMIVNDYEVFAVFPGDPPQVG